MLYFRQYYSNGSITQARAAVKPQLTFPEVTSHNTRYVKYDRLCHVFCGRRSAPPELAPVKVPLRSCFRYGFVTPK